MARSRLRIPLLAALLSLVFCAGAVSAADFPEITDAERALTHVPGHPNAPAVVLFKKGELTVQSAVGVFDPFLVVRVRRKILTEEGKKYGEISLFHSKRVTLKRLEGRTVLPDGQEIRLSKDAISKPALSTDGKQLVTSFNFPGVEAGAILDYEYEIRHRSRYLLEPWIFQEELPILHSEVVYRLPPWLLVRTALLDPLKTGVKKHSAPEGVWAWGRDLPPLPQEPQGQPTTALASRLLVSPIEVINPRPRQNDDIFGTWSSACTRLGGPYEKALNRTKETGRKAREIAAAADGPREKSEAVYRFVRDGIETVKEYGIELPEGSTVDAILASRRGNYAAKAVLLQAMLGAVDIPARLVWVGERDSGTIQLDFVTPLWFERVIVAAEIDGRRVFLDPSDRSLAFGRLGPGLEGMPALIFDRTSPETVTLPSSPYKEG